MKVILEGYQNRPLYYKSFSQLNNQLEQASKTTGCIYMCEYDIKEDIMKVKVEQDKKQIFSNTACKNCSNNPKNGGTGICHCTLGTPPIIC